MHVWQLHARAFSFKKAYCAHTKIVALHAAALGLRDWHVTHRGVAMIFFAKPILNSQLSHTISTSLAYIFSFPSVWRGYVRMNGLAICH